MAEAKLLDEFFESGREESISPFLTPDSRKWGKNLSLKSSLVAAIFLFSCFLLSFFPKAIFISHFFLLLTFFFAGVHALIQAIEDLANFDVNIDVLMTLAAFLSVLIGSGIEGGLLLVLFSFSGSLEEAVRSKAKSAISTLKKISPQTAFLVLADGALAERSVKDVKIGDKIHVKAGEVVPLDGLVVQGSSTFNLSHLTGEALPVFRTVGNSVPAGAYNLEGALTLSVTHTSFDSTLTRLIELITKAHAGKPKLQRWLDEISKRYALSIILMAVLSALLLPLAFSIPYAGPGGSIYRALAFLIAASPCALILGVPIAYLSAISAAARKGIVLKGGMVLDALAGCKTVAFDKTGTLTKGELVCTGFEGTDKQNEKAALAIGYALEQSSSHPMAKAVCKFAQVKQVPPASISHFRQLPGMGLEALYENKPVYMGNADLILPKVDEKDQPELQKKIALIQERGELFTLLLIDAGVWIFRFKDELRPKVKQTLSTLKEKWKMRLVMLTGDYETSAQHIAVDSGISEYYAHLRPEDKLNFISKQNPLVMVGDGVNDAPSLACASVGISMGKIGSGAAIEASDVVLLQDNLENLDWLIGKSMQTKRVVKQNLAVAIAAIAVATFGALFGLVPLWLAVVLHEGGTVLVGFNALRLLKT